MRIAAVLGSIRPNNLTGQALHLAVDELLRHAGLAVDLIDPAGLPMALPGQAGSATLERELVARIERADGVLFATPEYQGSFSSVVKALIDQMGYPSALAGKPVALLGVASGQIGAVKSLEHLRGVCAHVGALVLPYPVSVALVDSVFDEAGHCLNPAVEDQIRGLARRLIAYLLANRGAGNRGACGADVAPGLSEARPPVSR